MFDGDAKNLKYQRIAGVPVVAASEQELVNLMVEDACRAAQDALSHPVVVADLNAQAISMREVDHSYRAALEAADIVHADGQFIVWLSRLLRGASIPERTATTDLIHGCATAAVQNDLSFYLLGSPPDINQRCGEALQRQHPGLQIAGQRDGYFSREEEAAVLEAINASGADVLWIGLGKPKEQQFAARNRDKLNCAWIVTCGGCFHFVAGDYARAPLWMQRAGLEWLHRMATGPGYLIRRYLLTIPHALAIVLVRDVLRGGRNRDTTERGEHGV